MNALLTVALMGVVYVAPPTVFRFLSSDAFVRVIHGPVGSSKSSGCNSELFKRSLEQAPHGGVRNTRWAVVRNTYRELEDTTRKTFEQWVGPFGEWREADFAFDIEQPAEDGSLVKSEVLFRALDRPQDVRKLLSLEITGAYVNELREVPKDILDGLTMRAGRFPSMADGGPSWYGVWGDTNPWSEDSEYAELFRNPPEGYELFRQPSALSPEAENVRNLVPGYYQRMMLGKSREWVDEYVHGKNPKADKGSVYGELITALRERGGVSDFQHPADGVFAVFDLGVSDSTAIWWFRIRDGLPDVVDWYEASGKGAQHYFDVLDGKTPEGVDRARRYGLQRIYLPHDARQRTFQTGVSTLDQFLAKYPGKVSLTPGLDVAAGIDGARWLLEQPMRFHSRAEEGLKRLKSYRYEWDEAKKVFKKTPLHDFSSHSADSFRYLAEVVKPVALAMKTEAPKQKPIVRDMREMSLDEMIEASESSLLTGGRV